MFVVHQVAFLSAFNSLASATHSSHRRESAYLAVIHPPGAPTALFSSHLFPYFLCQLFDLHDLQFDCNPNFVTHSVANTLLNIEH